MKLNKEEIILADRILKRTKIYSKVSLNIKKDVLKMTEFSHRNNTKRFYRKEDTLDTDSKLQAMMLFMNIFYFLYDKNVFRKHFKRYSTYYEYLKKNRICYNTSNYTMLHKNVTLSIFKDLKQEIDSKSRNHLRTIDTDHTERKQISLYNDLELLNEHVKLVKLLTLPFVGQGIMDRILLFTKTPNSHDKYIYGKGSKNLFSSRNYVNKEFIIYFLIH